MQLWMKTLIGMVLGLLFGFYIPDYAIQLKFLGDVFLKLIKMVIPFIVFFAVMKGIIGQNTDDLKGIGLKAVIYYIITTIFAVLIGMVMAFIMKPGQGIDILQITGTSSSFDLSASVDRLLISDFILSVIPVNIFQSFIELNILQILFFAIILSLTINSIGLSSAFKTSVENGLNIFITMILYIMELAPYAIFVFFSVLVSTLGLEIINTLSYLLLTTVIAMLVQYIFFGIMLFVFTGLSPWVFYRKSLDYQIFAFSTSSTKATLPISIKVAKERLGMSDISSSVVLPLGASINMDGIAIYLNIVIYFFSMIYGIEFFWFDYIKIIFATTIACIGGAGLPGGTIMMMPMVFSLVGIPLDGIPLVIVIDRLVDLFRTVISITGDVVVACIIDSQNNLLDEDIYYK